MWSDPPPRKAVAKRAIVAAASRRFIQHQMPSRTTRREALMCHLELAMREKFGRLMMEESAKPSRVFVCLKMEPRKSFGGAFIITTKIETNPNTGAPADWVYTIENRSLRDADITLDFDQSKGVGAMTLEYKASG